MALFIRQSDERSKLQQRIAAELQEKSKLRASAESLPDGVTDSQYLKDTKQTTGIAWVWVVLVVIVAITIMLLTVQSSTG